MATKNPRLQVTLNPDDMEIIGIIAKKKSMSMGAVVKKVVEDWLEEYEDMMLAKRAEEAEARWIANGCETVSLEDLCQELDIKLSSEENLEKNLFNSPKISRKESSKQSTKGLHTRRKMAKY